MALVETVSFLVVLGATALHRVLDGPDLVFVPGLFHGVVFLVYVVLALKIKPDQGWDLLRLVLVVILAAVPLGGLWVERRLVVEPATAGTEPAGP